MASLVRASAIPSHTCIVGGVRKECAMSARPCSLHNAHLPGLRFLCSSSSKMTHLELPQTGREKRASTREQASPPHSCVASPTAAVQCTTRFRAGSSHTQRACTVVLVSAVSAGDCWVPSGMVLSWQVLACAYEAVRGTEKKQVRSPTPV
ncbi:hypothetical protein BU25DRAFT_417058 [Macroventuria anomochaeta]|uniref:Uncharacterized protein n=1 Tax=Macroventuria anomochaeta TaxID=301207 RepID=A0ACB6SIU0_9PLEO|nr:uncharacterized protein BU25DRAFT_417058 [Macroventuria anomochaeta]KAF2633932.1 hypothetical protein BU25DRAFT_417058 [Macroventuria anomochaeta]